MTDPRAPGDDAVSPTYERQIVATEGDIDELGHVSNVTFVLWVQEIAKAHSAAVGWDFARYRAEGCVFVVHRHEIRYLAQAFAGDVLLATTWIASWRGASSERRTRIVRASDGREVVVASTSWVLVGAADGRPRRIPPSLVEAFAR